MLSAARVSKLEKLLKVELETVAPNALADQQKITNRAAAVMSSLNAQRAFREQKQKAASAVKGLNLTVDDQSSKHDEDGADDKVKAQLLFSNQELSVTLSKSEFDRATPEPLPGASADTSKQEGQKLAKDKLESTKRANKATPASAAPLKPSMSTADMLTPAQASSGDGVHLNSSSTPTTTTTTTTTTTSTAAAPANTCNKYDGLQLSSDHRQPLRSSNDFSTSYGPHSYQSNVQPSTLSLPQASIDIFSISNWFPALNRSLASFTSSSTPRRKRVAKDAALLEAFLTDAGVKPEDQLSLGRCALPNFPQTRHQSNMLVDNSLPGNRRQNNDFKSISVTNNVCKGNEAG
ncbi:hypothetical protein BY996DRAFT_8529868 [Phakopsora pachyrhizi]|nr:hypothetical protein BY996DRAFT_8529868 [Phakopsora pachyrhizi]